MAAGHNSDGENVEVVYDPDRYDVVVVRGGDPPDPTLDTATGAAARLHGTAAEPRKLVHGRVAVRRAAKDRQAGTKAEAVVVDVGPTRPFLRPLGSSEPVPPGWIAEPADVRGAPSDDPAEIVYHPQRHDVMRLGPASSPDEVVTFLAERGWTHSDGDSTSQVLWRDRVAHARLILEPSTPPPSAEPRGLGL